MSKTINLPDLVAIYLEFADRLGELRAQRNFIEPDYFDLENEYRLLAHKAAPKKPPLTKIEVIWPDPPPRSDWERGVAGLPPIHTEEASNAEKSQAS